MAAQARFYVYEDRAGSWRWQLVAGENADVVAVADEAYETEQYAYEVVNWIRLNAANVPIVPGELVTRVNGHRDRGDPEGAAGLKRLLRRARPTPLSGI